MSVTVSGDGQPSDYGVHPFTVGVDNASQKDFIILELKSEPSFPTWKIIPVISFARSDPDDSGTTGST